MMNLIDRIVRVADCLNESGSVSEAQTTMEDARFIHSTWTQETETGRHTDGRTKSRASRISVSFSLHRSLQTSPPQHSILIFLIEVVPLTSKSIVRKYCDQSQG
jgi:hypothetical protein